MFVPVRFCAQIRATFRLVFGLLVTCVPALGFAATFTVNSTDDVPDATPGDGFCRTASNNTTCTLRAAIMEANALAGIDTINLQANTTYFLGRSGDDADAFNGDLDITASVNIVGAGPDSTVIDGNGAVVLDRVIEIVSGTVDISGVAIRHGKQSGGNGGGGIRNTGGTLTLENCAITDNNSGAGGGISTQATTTVIGCTISGNQGGGIFQNNSSTLTVVNSTISGNTGSAFGGGIGAAGATFNAINTTISGNFTPGDGAGLYVSGASVGLYNVTVAGNTANSDDIGVGNGGGLFNAGGTVTLANSIVTDNIHKNDGSLFDTLDDCSGSFTSQGNNLVTFVLCTITGPNSTASPALGPLQDNGGPTFTHALLAGSAAIDTGNPGGCTDNNGDLLTTDQRGEPRFGAACDIGAFERGDVIFKNGFEP